MLIITIRNRNICLYGAVVFREYRKMGWIDDDEIYVGHNEAYELLCSRPFACLPFYFSSGSTTHLTLSLYAAMCTNFLVVPNIKIVILMTRPLLVSLKLNSFFRKHISISTWRLHMKWIVRKIIHSRDGEKHTEQ